MPVPPPSPALRRAGRVPPILLSPRRRGASVLFVARAPALRAMSLPFPARAAWGALAAMGFLDNALPCVLIAAAQREIDAGPAAILN